LNSLRLKERSLKEVFKIVFFGEISPLFLILFSFIITYWSYSYQIDFGLTFERPGSVIVWHFCHRTYGHFFNNSLLLALIALSSNVTMNLFEILLLSAFPFALTYFDRTPFYGMSLIIFFLVSKMLLTENLLEEKELFGPIKVPKLLPVFLFLFSIQHLKVTSAVQFSHLWSCFLAFGLYFDPKRISLSFKEEKYEKRKKEKRRLRK